MAIISKLKYIIIPYIALGFVLSLAIGIEYVCDGQEMYYGSPVVFKVKSLGSSLTYYFSIYGLIINVLIWCIPIILARVVILHLIKRTRNSKVLTWIYKGVVIALLLFTTLNVAIGYVMMGSGFNADNNYWYIDMDKEAEAWGMKCEGEWVMFGE